MRFYELMLVLKPLPRQDTLDCLKRIANVLWTQDGVIKKIDYLGQNQLPYKLSHKGEALKYTEGNRFLFHLSLNTDNIHKIRPELKLELDVLKTSLYLSGESKLPVGYECTLEQELLPPPFRESVRPLLEEKNVKADFRKL